jgi:hypothetical protein
MGNSKSGAGVNSGVGVEFCKTRWSWSVVGVEIFIMYGVGVELE